MKIKFGSLVVDGRGKIGGHVASKNRSGAYLRTKVTPVNRRSVAQTNARGLLSSIAIAWRGLSAAVINSWNHAVSDFSKTDIFGDSRNPTGFSLYQKLNNNSLRNGGAAITTPPLPAAVPFLSALSATAVHSGAVSLTYAASPVPAGVAYEVWATKAVSPGVSFVKSEFRIIASLAPAAATPFVATAAYVAVFGQPGALGKKIFFQVKAILLATGQAGAVTQTSCILT